MSVFFTPIKIITPSCHQSLHHHDILSALVVYNVHHVQILFVFLVNVFLHVTTTASQPHTLQRYKLLQVWHILSAVAIYFMFMFLLNVDEDIKFKRRSHIAVF